MLFITGIVMTFVPLLLMIGFSFFIFLSFVRDDPDAAAVTRVAFLVMGIGIVLLIWHFASRLIE